MIDFYNLIHEFETRTRIANFYKYRFIVNKYRNNLMSERARSALNAFSYVVFVSQIGRSA
jgi:hypothetical protein